MKKKWINFLLFVLISFYCSAQTEGYKFYSKLDSIRTAGFYNIEITPELSAHLKTDYSDIRIVNGEGKWIPHILHAQAYERTAHEAAMYLKFSIAENSNTNTVIIIENGKNISSNIGLIISNTAAERFCTLSGGNDKSNWFIINDSILLNPIAADSATENTFRINFPSNNYAFYKLTIHNHNKYPFNIKGVVKEGSATYWHGSLSKLQHNPSTSVLQKDSGKISYIKITQQQPYQFDNISLQLSGVKYYNRKIDLYIPYAGESSFTNPGQLLQSFTVSNNSTLQYNILLTKSAVFYLFINNEDNLPLTVTSIKTACSNRYITAYLENGSNYRLIIDNENAVMPNYDLSKLNSKIPDSISFLHFGKITAIVENKPTLIKPQNNKWMLWFAIAAALLTLLFFTYRMLNEVDKRKNT
jgi:hypothetical protein